MGYSEVLCHICGVSFNIGRIRTPKEPRSAAWSRFGPILHNNLDWRLSPNQQDSYVCGHRSSWVGECHRDSGCMFTIRMIKNGGREYLVDARGKRTIGPQMIDEHEAIDANTDWEEQGSNMDNETDEEWDHEEYSSEEEFLEYCSDGSVLDGNSVNTTMMENDSAENNSVDKAWIRNFWLRGITESKESLEKLSINRVGYPAWYSGVPHHIPFDTGADIMDDMFPLFYPGRDDASEHGSEDSFVPDPEDTSARLIHKFMGKLGYYHMDENYVEHIAGEGCQSVAGYSGHEIAVSEMRACQTLQCLVRKPKGWLFNPLPDDEDFERNGEFFLSGLSDHMPSRDCDCPRVTPVRHGCEDPHAENCMWTEDQADDYAMPFHPSCFEIFKRTSLLLNGKVDIVGLTSWWSLEANYDHFNTFPRDPNVDKCREQEWKHHKGTAYLAANPLYVPSLKTIFEASLEWDINFNPRSMAFQVLRTPNDDFVVDPFTVFPAELRIQILDNLSSKDIAMLRLSSRSFSQISVAYFQKLIVRELPWLWEAWPTRIDPSQMLYSIWAALPAARANTAGQEAKHKLKILNDYVNIVKSEMPELETQLEEALSEHFEAIQAEHVHKMRADEVRTPFFLPKDRTNYFTLYTLITRHWHKLRGLQNRKRIWKDCEEILRRVEAYREEGRIGEHGITENLRDVVRNHNLEQRRRREERDRIRREQNE